MARNLENTGFVCASCHANITALTNGSYRNHCPFCLYSLHVDVKPGDRASACGGLMKPSALKYHSKKGWQIVHVCLECGARQPNKVASDTAQPDDIVVLAQL